MIILPRQGVKFRLIIIFEHLQMCPVFQTIPRRGILRIRRTKILRTRFSSFICAVLRKMQYETDFSLLFAIILPNLVKVIPTCVSSDEFIIGRVIKAMNASWHPKCFRCEICWKELADLGFAKHQERALCHDCANLEKATGLMKYNCFKCQ